MLPGVTGQQPYLSAGEGLNGNRPFDDFVVGDGQADVAGLVEDDLQADLTADPTGLGVQLCPVHNPERAAVQDAVEESPGV
ncbi:hypothetical protein ACWCP8_32415 [Streptomyces sp. NPDC002206]